jgi:FlaA1/EpsC-like NDP-sugar epimerase
MAKGGDIFVLDMGKPVRIRDLAERMIHLMGLTVRGEQNADGDIEIQYTGLRPAEKLHEDLLIGNNVTGTEHPRIMRAEEGCFAWPELKGMLDQLRAACNRIDCATARDVLLRAVDGYAPAQEVEDLVWQHKRARVAGGGKVMPLEVRRSVPVDRSH